MTDYTTHPHKRGHTHRHCREDALSEREFELLFEAAQRIEDYRGLETRFVIVAAGRLGLRAGEIAHCRESWVDWRESMVSIPAHQPCSKGRDGGICGTCRQHVTQCAEYNDLDMADLKADWWRPKTQAAVRGVPFDWNPRVVLTIERFFDRFDAWNRSQNAVNRRLKTAAERADGLDKANIYPHALRATAASYQASHGLGPTALTSMMGWADISTAQIYIARSDENTRRAVHAVHSR